MRLDVQASGYDSAAEALVGANQVAAIAFEGLTSKLTGFHALGGDDKSSEDFVKEYDASAQEAVDALRALVDGLGNLGEITAASVENHRRAHAESVYGKPRPSYEGGVPGEGPVTVSAVSLPSSLGGDNEDMPDWWNHVVDHLQGWGWPSANTDQLRSAASAWKTAAGQVSGLTGKIDTANSHLRGQRSPEIPTATRVLTTTRGHIQDLADCLTEQGAACEDYAKQVDETRQTIKDLLKDLAIECGVTAGASVALSFVTFGGAAAVGAGVIAARAVKYAHRILTALKALKAARAVLKLAKNAPKLNRVRRSLEDLKTARKLAQLKQIARPKTKYDPTKLQKKYKHAKDFGVKEPWKKGAGEKFQKAVDDFLDSPGTKHRDGTYNGDPATLSFNPTTGQVVVTSRSGDFVTGFKMNYTQLQHVIRDGKLGGH
jgi:hypothetical protein